MTKDFVAGEFEIVSVGDNHVTFNITVAGDYYRHMSFEVGDVFQVTIPLDSINPELIQ